MPGFVTAPYLRAFFEAGLIQEGRTIVAATLPQVRAIKNEVLAKNGGSLGLEVITPKELKTHARKVMRFEGAFVWAGISQSNDWGRCEQVYEDMERWCGAGLSLAAVPLPDPEKAFLGAWEEHFRRRRMVFGWEGAFLPHGKKIALAGFDPVEALDIIRQNEAVIAEGRVDFFLIEPDGASREQLAAMASLESILGEPQRMDCPRPDNALALSVNSPTDLPDAILHVLSQEKSIDGIVYKGGAAGAAMERLFLKLALPASGDWASGELLQTFKKAQQSDSWVAKWEFLRSRDGWGGSAPSEIALTERKAGQSWSTGAVVDVSSFIDLPEFLAIADLKKAVPPELWEANAKRFEKLTALVSPSMVFSRRVLLSVLAAQPQAQARNYLGVAAVPLRDAWGLMDTRTLFVSSHDSDENPISLLPVEVIARHNRSAIEGAEGNERLVKNWIYLGDALKLAQTQAAAQFALVVRCDEERPEVCTEFERPNARANRAPRDFELPFQGGLLWGREIPAKRWEEIVRNPELAWFALVGAQQSWRVSQKSPISLWVGTWVHEAVRADDGYFANKLAGFGDKLVFRTALARAWELASIFKAQLAGLTDIKFEQRLSGCVNGVPTHGIADVVARDDKGTVVLDFKTSSQDGKITVAKKDYLDTEGKGLQLWLYGRMKALEGESVRVAIVSPKSPAQELREITPEVLSPEKTMACVARDGVLGHGKDTFNPQSGKADRLPYATWAEEMEDDDD